MFVVCLNNKYGFCKYGKKCDKIHLTDVSDDNEKCKEKHCDKRHPAKYYYFDTHGRCKFGKYCMYMHLEST